MPPMEAAVEATKEIGLAVLATTLSLVAIFVPVGFMSGMVGRFMQSFGLTMAFAIMVSLLVSFTLTPMMSSRWLKLKRAGCRRRRRTTRSIRRFFGPIDRAYARDARVVDGASRVDRRPRRGRAAVERAALPASSASPSSRRTTSRGSTSACARPRAPASRRREVMANRIGAAIRRIPEVDYTLVTVAGDGAGTQNSASIFVKLQPIEARERDQFAVMAQVRNEIVGAVHGAGLRASVGGGGGGGGGGRRRAVRAAGARAHAGCRRTASCCSRR